jgi:hypothetical protein
MIEGVAHRHRAGCIFDVDAIMGLSDFGGPGGAVTPADPGERPSPDHHRQQFHRSPHTPAIIDALRRTGRG